MNVSQFAAQDGAMHDRRYCSRN